MMPSISLEWTDDAACKGADTELFFPSKGERSDVARIYCSTCPVQAECFRFAMAMESVGGYHHYGIYGGTGPAQRKRLASARNKQRALDRA